MAALGDDEMLSVPLPPSAATRSRPLTFMKTIIGECLCEPFPSSSSNGDHPSLSSTLMMKVRGALSFASPQFLELHGIQFIGLGAIEDELTAKQRVYDTLEQLTTRTDRLISIGCLVDTPNTDLAGPDGTTVPQSSYPSSGGTNNNVTVTTQSIPYDLWNATYPNDRTMSGAVKKTIANIKGRNFNAALADFRRSYTQQKRHPSRNGNAHMLGITVHNMGVVSVLAGRDGEALPLFEEAVAVKSSTFGPYHPEVAISLDELGIQLFAAERYEDAFYAFNQSHNILAQVYGPDHPSLAMVLNNMACCAFQVRDMDAALSTMSRAMDLQKATTTLSRDVGDKTGSRGGSSANNADMELLHTAILLNNLGYLRVCVKEYDEARACFDEALLIQQSVLGDAYNHRAIRDSRSNLEFTNVFHSEG